MCNLPVHGAKDTRHSHAKKGGERVESIREGHEVQGFYLCYESREIGLSCLNQRNSSVCYVSPVRQTSPLYEIFLLKTLNPYDFIFSLSREDGRRKKKAGLSGAGGRPNSLLNPS